MKITLYHHLILNIVRITFDALPSFIPGIKKCTSDAVYFISGFFI